MVSLSKNKIKYIHSLELKKIRKEERVFLAEGPKLVGDLLGHFPCCFLAATASWIQEHPDLRINSRSFSRRSFTSQFTENSAAGACCL